VPRCRLGSKDTIAPFHYIKIKLKDAILGKLTLELQSDKEFLGLAEWIFRFGQKQIARELLCDGGCTVIESPLLPVALCRLLDGVPDKPMVIAELVVLGDDHSVP
jgi:hypothetical protein